MDTVDGHLLLEKRHRLILLERANRGCHLGLLAQAEKGPEDYTDMSRGPQPPPLAPILCGKLRMTKD